MNKDSIFGKAKEIAGTMQESFGKAIHNDKVTAGGQHAQEAGREQSATAHGTSNAPKKEEMKK